MALLERLRAVGLVQSGVVLAAQTFLALFPLLMAAAALLPKGASDALRNTLRHRVGVSGRTDESVGALVASRSDLRGAITVAGAIVVLASATSFTRALQRVYENSWELPRVGLKGSLRGLMWLGGLIVYLSVLGAGLRFAGSGATGSAIRGLLVVVLAFVLWWWTPYVLLSGRVTARALLPTGLLTAAVLLVMGQLSTVVVPRTVRSNERQFGTIGAVFAIESWLVVISCAIVGAAVVGAVLAQAHGPVGQLARGDDDPEAWRRLRRGDADRGDADRGDADPAA